ncbi:MAG: hypothetical protein HZA24_09310 [Nitrospirae bacterium]|nr:hypothetical protein [Nitrospirota bacterium]
MNKAAFASALAAFLLGLSWGTAEARHLKLYSYDVLSHGQTAVTYTYDYVSGVTGLSGHPNLHEIEIEHGITNRWTQSIYIDYDVLGGRVSEISALKTEFNYAFFEKGQYFADFRLNVEYAKAINNKVDAFDSTNAADTIEFRPIFEKDFDTFVIVLSPVIVKELSAPNGVPLADWNYGYANAVMMTVNEHIGVNLEFHGSTTDDTHYLVPNVDVALGDNMSIGLGVGFGLTRNSDDFTFRASIVRTFGGSS